MVNYEESIICKSYLFDKSVNQLFTDRRTILKDQELREFLEYIETDVEHLLHEEESFSYTTYYRQKYYTIHFISLLNIDGTHVGYVYEILIDNEYAKMKTTNMFAFIAITFIFLSLTSAMILYVFDKERIKRLVKLDYLTNLLSRRYFMEYSEKELARSIKNNFEYFYVVMDIDHFKKINDELGHLSGDEVLKQVAECIKKSIRPLDIAARWGGEEFILLLSKTTASEAIQIVSNIQKSLSEISVSSDLKITMSYGIVSSKEAKSLSELFHLADQKMYQAKDNGRNQYVI